jgi:hypothetical protein
MLLKFWVICHAAADKVTYLLKLQISTLALLIPQIIAIYDLFFTPLLLAFLTKALLLR